MSVLVALAAQAGLPILEKVLTRKIGSANAELATEVLRSVADRAGTTPDNLDALAESMPGRVIDAMREVEKISPEMIALYAAGLEGQFALLKADREDPAWMRAWRPGWMYLLGLFWLWNVVLLHVANAIWKIALPVVPFEQLLGLTSVFMALYMGGHTLLRSMAKTGDK